MQAVILAGGLGTRLRPLTHQIPKVMVLIKGKPFLEYILELLKRNNLKKIVLCVGYLGEKIENHFGNGKKWGMDIKYSFEKEKGLLGTGGALKNTEPLLENEFIVLYGDTFLNINYQDLISYFYKQDKLGVMAAFTNQPKTMLNNIEVNNKNEIINYDKKKEEKANCVDAGVLVFKKGILNLFPAKEKFSLEEEVYPVLIQKREFITYPTSQKFYDIGTFERLKNFYQIL